MFPMSDLGDDLFLQPETVTETLHSESVLRDDILAPVTTAVAERSTKFNPKSRIINKCNQPKPSKCRASESPSSTSKFHNTADDEHVEKFQSEPPSITKEYSELDSLPLHNEFSDVHGLSFSADGLNESLEVKAQNCSPAYSSEERGCCETLHSDSVLRDDILAPVTTAVAERSTKFNPKPRIINNCKQPKPSNCRASESPSSASKFHNAADDEHVKKFQAEPPSITKRAKSNFEYFELDSLPLHNEFSDVHGLSFSMDGLNESLEVKAQNCSPAYSSEERVCCSNIIDLEAQSLVENEDLPSMEREQTTNHIEEPNLEDCTPSIVPNDDIGQSSRKTRQRNKKLKTSEEDIACKPHDGENTVSEMDDDYDGEGYNDNSMPKQKRRKLPKRSSKKSREQENPIKSNEEAAGEPGSTVKGSRNPKKKLPHGSSRCKRTKRQVNKALLDIPDDELDRKQIAIRDLIRLAGFKERLSNKVEAVFKNLFDNQSVEKEQELNGDDANIDIQQQVPRLNYHSYMRRQPQNRWSKTDTEFFYQAVRQFGTDFAMIQLLFPNRSRQQVKAKFKNEQRKHPLQIADALVHRSKDHSHFEKAIQHLQTMAEQKSKNDADDPTAAQSQDEAYQNEEEGKESNSKEDQDVNFSEDWDGYDHIPADDDFDPISEAADEMENSWM